MKKVVSEQNKFEHLDFTSVGFSEVGLNMHHIFSIPALSGDLLKPVKELNININDYSQLIMIGHSGNKLWRSIPENYKNNQHPVDSFCVDFFSEQFKKHYPKIKFKVLYPRHTNPLVHFNLQKFGDLAGWHHTSPMRIGINESLGTWFAYRLLVIAQSDFLISQKIKTQSPCESCEDIPCEKACPVQAVTRNGNYDWRRCFEYRASANSQCNNRCLARMSCPIAQNNQYSLEQIQYHYNLSLSHLGVTPKK
ncbi:hypothetical protein [Pleionea sediminis]|uniref:hypothetical protein n=1 Tax=Pleionea sediminis TaxID=2569479 RepID=UPI0011848579|nr:hypothetical protein [Pleionea sediminis]